jgi:hypothetical protein
MVCGSKCPRATPPPLLGITAIGPHTRSRSSWAETAQRLCGEINSALAWLLPQAPTESAANGGRMKGGAATIGMYTLQTARFTVCTKIGRRGTGSWMGTMIEGPCPIHEHT